MSDRYIDFANSPIGRRMVGSLGLPSPVRLERWQAGRLRPIEGALLLGGGPLTEQIGTFAKRLTDTIFIYGGEPTLATEWIPGHGPKIKAVVYDASHLVQADQFKQLREFFQPLMKNLDHSAHVVILGRAPEKLADPFAASAQRALEGFSRSLAKELRHGGTLQLLYVGDGAEAQLEGALRFFLSPKSAFISGQVIRLNACDTQVQDWTRPLTGLKALVTGAARGIGASIAETLARDGADVILLDVPQAKTDLDALAARLSGRSVTLDICAEDAAAQLIGHLPDGVDIVVHNAGITRDKTLANMTPEFWDAVLAVNLNAPQVLTKALLDSGTLRDNGRVILLASISGIAGNRGQTNYAASKAGLIGLAQAWAPVLQPRGISINAVAPGFIETRMTADIPFALREAGRRMSSLGQGGLPQDVAEAVAWLAQPGTGAVTGQALRVCGQSLLGA
ncbi:3-oxoacyl-ACP reductase [Pseudomonas brassicacearum]|uniref:3-oxoacyl-ACP reductase n=1 Tax=Pseudomonas brassicacearum TaxID=930166 RepID=UPI00025FE8AA|nr:3-oxoacyl-ACP reductase [Pseudomonas brassicacearum]EIK70990.1 oxidoreductase, short chain dehydrogenase/reductase family protein [Pseudomonas fluorescens Q8r1-96]KAB0524909.1 3-oxoacyl-ACP reductase [Pseudomonas brassicacearum subsp. brassicacearum]NJP62249.1 3-oxoacyl-ACP reductase [Pseudomonas brassicacearum]QEO76680.1 3-oxoacyl-ACP reductase [Pseudomonas brassicacearum]SDP98691.1 3-oxoacyl-[acyl-carrier protein] reductase [Pseudomonas brassicacearum]